MRSKITAACLALLFLFNTCAYAATVDQEIQQLKQEYISIYNNLDPLIAAKMDTFIDDVIDYAVVHYDAGHDLNIDIKNAVASTLLTGTKYKEDLMPFLLEQSKDKEKYREQLTKMRDIVNRAVLARVQSNSGTPSTGTGGGGTVPKDPTDSITVEVNQQLKAGAASIKLEAKTNQTEIVISDLTLKKIITANKDLNLKFDNIEMKLPLKALKAIPEGQLIIISKPETETKGKTLADRAGNDYQLIGKVYELYSTTGKSLNQLNFSQPISVVISYKGIKLDNVNEDNLDAYYHNEKTSQWEKMNGTVDKANKTVTFKTTHFSKYAIMAYTPATTATNPPLTIPNRFTDINGHWAQTKIETLVNLGLVSGISDTEFAPQQNITRAEFAAILVRALKLPFEVQYQGQFFDVQADQWYFSVVNTAAKAGLINGYDKNHFGPNDPVTREQMALMIKNAMDYKGKNVELTDTQTAENLAIFSDTYAIAAWARTSVATAVQAQIITGHSDGRFAPHDNATRAQAAVMILQMYNQI